MSSQTCIVLAAAVIGLLATDIARADATYRFSLQGTDQHYYPPCRLPGQPPPCNTIVDRPWTGSLNIVLGTSADGIFSDTDVLSFDFQTNLGRLTSPLMPSGSVTVSDGMLTSIDFNERVPAEDGGDYFFIGMHADYYRNIDGPHNGSDFAFGQLTAVPEPAIARMMLLALACAAGAGALSSLRAVPRRRAWPHDRRTAPMALR